MAKAEASVEELVGMIERGELRLPEMQRRFVWKAPRVRDLLDSLYRGYPSGAILLWETDEDVPLRDFTKEKQNSLRPHTPNPRSSLHRRTMVRRNQQLNQNGPNLTWTTSTSALS